MKNKLKNFLQENREVLIAYSIGATTCGLIGAGTYIIATHNIINSEVVKAIRNNGLTVDISLPDDLVHLLREANALKAGIPQ